jgi:hypothetical protein
VIEEFQNVCLVESDKASVAITSRCVSCRVVLLPCTAHTTPPAHARTHVGRYVPYMQSSALTLLIMLTVLGRTWERVDSRAKW